MKHEIEFYDQHGLLLHSDPHYQTREISTPVGTSHDIVVESTFETLEEQGEKFPRAKTVTIRSTHSQRVFSQTTDVQNPHWKEES